MVRSKSMNYTDKQIKRIIKDYYRKYDELIESWEYRRFEALINYYNKKEMSLDEYITDFAMNESIRKDRLRSN